MNNIVVRRAKSEDRKNAVFVEGQATPGLHYLDHVYEEWLLDPEGVLLVAELDDRLVGVGKFSKMPDGSAWLETLRVLPDYQGKGVGKAFYREFLNLAEDRGVNRLGMYTTPDNFASKGLADINGFNFAGEFRGSFLDVSSVDLIIDPEGFEIITSPDESWRLIEREASLWGGYGIMNRTFLRLSKELVSFWASKGFISHHIGSDSIIIMGARFMPEKAVHIAYMSGDLDLLIKFAISKTKQFRVDRLQCMYPEGQLAISAKLNEFGFRVEPYSCIVMEKKG